MTQDLSALPCPYCWAASGETCVEDCPQYPVVVSAAAVVGKARTADDLVTLRGSRVKTEGVQIATAWIERLP